MILVYKLVNLKDYEAQWAKGLGVAETTFLCYLLKIEPHLFKETKGAQPAKLAKRNIYHNVLY